MDFMVQAKIITGENVGKLVDIPRLLITPSDTRLPFKMRIRQLPVAVAFTITINKSQGQSISEVGIFLPRPVFSHGQLYVAVSTVTSKKGLKILAVDKDGKPQKKTKKVVFKEVFANLEEFVLQGKYFMNYIFFLLCHLNRHNSVILFYLFSPMQVLDFYKQDMHRLCSFYLLSKLSTFSSYCFFLKISKQFHLFCYFKCCCFYYLTRVITQSSKQKTNL